MRRPTPTRALSLAAALTLSATAVAQPEPDPQPEPFTLGGYVEAAYQWNFNEPANGVTSYRGFDNRHDTFTLSNVALDAAWDYEGVVGRLTLQVGHTPSAYYLAEPSAQGAGGANASDAELWKYLQQAYAGYRFPIGGGLTVTGGLFLSPIGPESIAVRDDWNWSRSNLFFGLPFYHTGLRASYALDEAWSLTLAGYNGWNSVLDGNDEKSLSTQLTYTRPELALSLLYFGGVERPPGAPEGRAWRHLFDAHATWHPTPWLSLLAQVDAGFEPNELGTSHWVAGALYARYRVASPLYLAVRGDAFYEHVPSRGGASASPIFWPAPWVSSGTATVDLRPHEQVSMRLELRHDQAGAPIYFGGAAVSAGDGLPRVSSQRAQNTLTLGLTTWF